MDDWTIEQEISKLGSIVSGNYYKPGINCMAILTMIEKELADQPSTSDSFRIRISECKLVESHLLHIMSTEHADDQQIISCSLRILVKLTLPLECILAFGECESCFNSCNRFHCLHDLLLQYKKVFLINSSATAALVKLIRINCTHENFHDYENSSQNELSLVNDVLLLLRNLLHVPDSSDFHRFQPFTPNRDYEKHQAAGIYQSSREEWQHCYRKTVWNLLVQGLDAALLSLLNHPQHKFLNPGIVQLISLMFKELNVVQMQAALQSGRANMDISDDDDEQSDSSSSVQRSSSSSCLSSDSSPQSSNTPSQNGEKDQEHPEMHSSRTNCSDSGLSGMGVRQISDKSESDVTDSLILGQQNPESDSQKPEKITSGEIIDGHSEQTCERDVSSEPGKGSPEDCPHKPQLYNSESSEADEKISSSNSNDNNDNHVVKSDANTEAQGKRANNREEQTSGISHGSSEEDQTRVTRKVIKAHHRSALHRDESDSSDEYNGKPPAVADHSQIKKNYTNPRPLTYVPVMVRSKCCPSVCMEAAFESGTKVIVIPSPAVTAPWEKRRTYGSKNFPLDLNSFVPTNEDIATLLKDFVFMLLHNSFSPLVLDLKHDMMQQSIAMDDSHFLWMIGYFTKLAVSIDLEFHHIQPLLTSEVLSFLVYKGVLLNEGIESAVMRMSKTNIQMEERKKFFLKKMHLAVSAIRELLYAVLSYMPKHDCRHDRESLRLLRYRLAEMSDLRQLLLLFIRNFLPTVHTKQFLVEVVVTHHLVMLLLEPIHMEGKFDLSLHLRQFATTQVMDHFGKILQDFKSNTDFVNDCVLTLMHHGMRIA
jgi:timeless protein